MDKWFSEREVMGFTGSIDPWISDRDEIAS